MKTVKRLLQFCTLLSMAAISTHCQSPSESSMSQPAAVITKKVELKGIPSASGIERIGNRYFIIGDDSPYLFCLNKDFEVTQKVLLLEEKHLVQERIPKPVKPDLEAITKLMLEDEVYLLILGSGSTSARQKAYLLPVTRNGVGQPRMVPLEKLYANLTATESVTGTAALNIEGLAADEEYLYLLQRFAPGGQNVLITYPLSTVVPFLFGRSAAPKPSAIHPFTLPELEKIKTGFSGLAPALGGRLLFTASAEETPNAVLDGEVYGSMVGWLRAHPSATPSPALPTIVVPITHEDGAAYKSKIESICILQQSSRHLEAAAVADNDDGFSELILLSFNW